MRGAPNTYFGYIHASGIIPADAGSTVSVVPTSAFAEDHPRGCGEHPTRISDIYMHQGSSPRMRGALGNEL